MLSVNSRRKNLSIVMEYLKSHDWTYYDDFPQQVANEYANLFDNLRHKPNIGEFLKRTEVIRTSFFRRNRVSRDYFFRELFQIIDSTTFEIIEKTGVAKAIDGTDQSENEYQIMKRLDKFEKELKKLVKSNLQIAIDIAGIWKELTLSKGKLAGLSGDIESIKDKITALVLILQIEENQKKGLINRIQGISKDIGLNIIADILFEILKSASGNK